MRKHNIKFAQRWSRMLGDRSNKPQQQAHDFVHGKFSKLNHMWSNALLCRLLLPYMPKAMNEDINAIGI